MAIRYDKKLNSEIDKTIRNFNSKVTRLEKQGKSLIIPDKITKAELKQGIYTRADLRRKMKRLQDFSKRGAETNITLQSGFTTTKWNLENIKKETTRIKRNLTREINLMQSTKPKIFGIEQSATFSQMGDPRYLNLLARKKALSKNISTLSASEFESFTKLLVKTGKNQSYMNNIFKENYLKMITDLGYYYGYDKEKLQILEDKLLDLNSNQFLKLFEEDKSINAITYYYPVITDTLSSIDPDDIKEDVKSLYDNLIDNLDVILASYE